MTSALARHRVVDYVALLQPLPLWYPKHWYFSTTRWLMRTIGQWSNGIALGERYGFDSGVMLDYVYRNKSSGRNIVGRLMDRAFLDAPGWKGIRERGALLRQALGEEISFAHGSGRDVHLLDVACGGGRYAVETLARHPGMVASATLRDYRAENIEAARSLAKSQGVVAKFEQADAFSDADLARVSPKPNLIVVSGLHEIIPDNATIEQHFKQLAAIAPRPATLVFTIQPWHPQVEFIARVLKSHTGMPWVMRLRSWAQTHAWAAAAGWKIRSTRMDSQGIFGVIVADLT